MKFNSGTNAYIYIDSVVEPSTAIIKNLNDDVILSGISINSQGTIRSFNWNIPYNILLGRYYVHWQGISNPTEIFVGSRTEKLFKINEKFISSKAYEPNIEFLSMHIDMRRYEFLSDTWISEFSPKSNYWLLDNNYLYNEPTEAIKVINKIKLYNPKCKVGIKLPYENYSLTGLASDFYDRNTSTLGYRIFPLMSGLSANASGWTDIWSIITDNTPDADFYILDAVTTAPNNTISNWVLNSNKEIIVRTNSTNLTKFPQLLVTGLSIAQYEQYQSSGVYCWTEDFNIAGYVGIGYYGVGAQVGDFVYKDSSETGYTNLEFLYYDNILTRRSAITSIPNHTERPKQRYATLIGQIPAVPMSVIMNSGLIPSGCDFYYTDLETTLTRINSYDPNMISTWRSYGTPDCKIGAYMADIQVPFYKWQQGYNNFSATITREFTDHWMVFKNVPWSITATKNNEITVSGYNHNVDDGWQRAYAAPTYWSGMIMKVMKPYWQSNNNYPSGLDITWQRKEKSGTNLSGIVDAYGDGYVYYKSGWNFNSFNLGDYLLSTHGWPVPDWADSYVLKTWEPSRNIYNRYFDIVGSAYNGLGLDYVHIDGPTIGGIQGKLWRNNESGLTTGQIRADWNGTPPGTTTPGNPNPSDPLYYWKGYINTGADFNSATSGTLEQTTLHGHNADDVLNKASTEYDRGVDYIYDHKDKWIQKFGDNKVQFNGADMKDKTFQWKDKGLYWTREYFVYDEVSSPNGVPNWEIWNAGDVWNWVNKFRSDTTPNITDIEIAKAEPNNFWGAYFGWAIALLIDGIACPGRHTWPGANAGGEDYNKQIYYSKVPIGDPINYPYKTNTIIRRDFTNGYVEIDDRGFNLKNGEQVRKFVRIVTFDYPRLPRFYKAMHSDPSINPVNISGIVPLCNYWKGDIENYYNNPTGLINLRNEIKQENPDCFIGANLHFENYPAIWQEEYTSGLTTLGARAYPSLSGVSPNWTKYWEHAINYTDLDFYVIEKVTTSPSQSIINWLNSYSHKQIIVDTDILIDYPHLKVSGLSLATVQNYVASGIYPWHHHFDEAGLAGCGNYSNLELVNNFVSITSGSIGFTHYYNNRVFIPSGLTARSEPSLSDVINEPGLYAHWRSTEGITLSGTNNVSKWTDRKNGYTLEYPSFSYGAPFYVSGINDIPTLRFYNSGIQNNSVLDSPITHNLGWGGISVYIVANIIAENDYSDTFQVFCQHSKGLAEGAFNFYTIPGAGGSDFRPRQYIKTQYNGQTVLTPGNSIQKYNTTNYNIGQITYNGSIGISYANGVQLASASVSGNLFDSGVEHITVGMGYNNPGSYFWPLGGDISEVIIFSGIETAEQRTKRMNYLNERYAGLTDWSTQWVTTRDPIYKIQ